MAKKAASPKADVLLTGLRTLAVADGPRRLLKKKGGHPEIFAAKKAAEESLTGDAPLVAVQGTGNDETVTLTAAGYARIAESLGALPVAERLAFLNEAVSRNPTAAIEFGPALDVAIAEEKAERDAEAARRLEETRREEAARAAVEKWMAALAQRKQDRIAGLKRQLEALGEEWDEPLPRERAPRPEPHPRPDAAGLSKDDLSFRRDVANQLASSWKETWNPDRPDVRDFLESAMWNIRGFKLLGEPGEQAAFDGRVHQCETPVSSGESVKVVRPGWLLEEGEGPEYVALKALVKT